jgi:hypothetical protein
MWPSQKVTAVLQSVSERRRAFTLPLHGCLELLAVSASITPWCRRWDEPSKASPKAVKFPALEVVEQTHFMGVQIVVDTTEFEENSAVIRQPELSLHANQFLSCNVEPEIRTLESAQTLTRKPERPVQQSSRTNNSARWVFRPQEQLAEDGSQQAKQKQEADCSGYRKAREPGSRRHGGPHPQW